MILVMDGLDVTDRWINPGSVISADITDTFGILTKAQAYKLRDYDDYFNPNAPEGYFNLNPYRGRTVVQTTDSGVVVFRGTIQNVQETDTQECIVSAAEPLAIFLDWPVEASDTTTHSGFLTNGAVAKGFATITIDGGSTTIPDGSVVYFGGSKVPSYLVTAHSPSSGATTSITLERVLENALTDNFPLTIEVPKTTTGPRALKDALTTSVPGILIDGTFEILHAMDTALGATIIINVMEQDGVPLRDYIAQIMEMTDLVLTQKNDGYYTLRRGLEWDRSVITDEFSADELCSPIEPIDDDSKLCIGYDLLYKSGENQAAILQADVAPALVDKHNGIKFWQPVKTAQSYAQLKYVYSSVSSAEYFGNRRLNYYSEPRKVINCTAKMAYHADANRPLDIYLGKQVRASVRTFSNVPAIVVGYEYNDNEMRYTRLALQLNETPVIPQPSASLLLVGDGSFLVTGDGFFIQTE
jgi:hypothetical protein